MLLRVLGTTTARELQQRGSQLDTQAQAYFVRLFGLFGDLEAACHGFVDACRLSKWDAISRVAYHPRTA
ncbi:hypothetical protein IWW50_004436, partial [Coemansia erecta]